MIESRYWRRELAKDIAELRKLREYVRWSEKRQVLFERKVMLIAFQIRSLLERPKVSKEVAGSSIVAVRHQAIESMPLDRAMGDIFSMYDWDAAQNKEMSVVHLCNQIIHYKYMFAQSGSAPQFDALVLVSDYKMREAIFKVPVDELILLFAKFIRDDSGLDREGFVHRLNWNKEKGEYVDETIE